MSSEAVEDSPCYRRVRALPRRTWAPQDAKDLAERLTAKLRTRTGRQTLRPIQALALVEAAKAGGGLFPIRVGGGKTLISFLLPKVVPCHKPLILLPASLVRKTEAEFAELRKDWVGALFYRLISYESLGRLDGAKFLDQFQPDLIVCDEAHKLKNPKAAVTRRVARFVKAARKGNQRLTCVFMSGTITIRSIKDFAHLANWALGDFGPAPNTYQTVEEWSRALDAHVPAQWAIEPGVLENFAEAGESVRKGYRRRLIETPGVVATQEPPLDVPLTITSEITPVDNELENAFKALRREGMTPSGELCADAIEVYRHARTLASGFYYVQDPPPPLKWKQLRSAWAAECREAIAHNKIGLDSELALKNAIRKAGYKPELAQLLGDWTEIEPTYDQEKHRKAVWLSDVPVQWILDWAKRAPGIVWVYTIALQDRLAEFGLPVFGEGAVDARGRMVGNAKPKDGTIVASVLPCSTGQNLQVHGWRRNLAFELCRNGAEWEQMIARTHRDGAWAGPVTVEIGFGCREDARAWAKSLIDADYAEEMTGQAQKITHADIEGVASEMELAGLEGYRWKRTTVGKVPLRLFGPMKGDQENA